MIPPVTHPGAPRNRAERRRVEARTRRVARQGTVGGIKAASRLILDPLEPRVLLNADTLAAQLATIHQDVQSHDVLIEMVQQTVQTNTQAQLVQRVQVIDRSNAGAVLAMGDLSSVSAITIAETGTGPSTVAIDLGSFGGRTAPQITVQGSGLTALAIAHGPGVLDWQADGGGTGTVTGRGAAVQFSGVDALAGGGADILHGPAADTLWQVTGAGQGTLQSGGASLAFQGFAALHGAANNADTFQIAPGGSVAGGIDGGAGGHDTLTYTGTFTNVVAAITGADSGSVTTDGARLDYAGLEFVDPAAANFTITLSGAGKSATLTDATGATDLVFAGAGVPTQSFTAPTQSLTVDLGAGGHNTLTLSGIDGRLASALTIQSEGSGDTVNVNSKIATKGGAVAITADTINLNSTLDTTLAKANAGGVSFTGQQITLAPGSAILAGAPTGKSAGAVSLSVSDTIFRAVSIPIDFTSKSVAIALTGATIVGGDVTIAATATDLPLAANSAAIPAYAAGFTSSLTGLLAQIPGVIISGLTGIDLSVIERGADAAISVDNTSITGSGAVTIASVGAAASNVQAFSVGLNPLTAPAGIEIAAGYAKAESKVTTSITGSSTITAAGDVTISSNAATTATTLSQASSGLVGAATRAGIQIAVAITDDQLISTATIGNAATIQSIAGNVNVSAVGATVSTPSTITTSYASGLAGVDVSLGFDHATVQSALNGHVTAAGQVNVGVPGRTGGSTVGFIGSSASTVNLTNSTLFVPGHGLQTGQEVTYVPLLSIGRAAPVPVAPIGGLVAGGAYYVLVVDADHIQLSTKPPIGLDPTGTNPAAKQSLSPARALDVSLGGIADNTLNLPAHGFADGDKVVYAVGAGSVPLAGLTNGATYTVKLVDADSIQLLQSGNVVTLAQNNATGTYTFTNGGNTQTLVLGQVNSSANTITIAGNPFTDGQTIVPQALTGGGIGGPQDGLRYTVKLVGGGAFQLLDPANGNAVVALSAQSGFAQDELAYSGPAIIFNPFTAANAVTDTITLPSTAAITTGQALIYHTDPALTSSQAVQVQQVENFTTGGIANSTIHLPANAFTDGDLVTYRALAGSGPLSGLVSGTQYQVKVVGPDDIQLLDPNTQAVIAVSAGTATGSYTFTDGTDTQLLTVAKIDSAANTITIAGNPLTDGATVVYQPLTAGQPIGALVAGNSYTVRVLSPGMFQLRDAANAVVALNEPAGADLHAFYYAAPANSGLTATVYDTPIGGLRDNGVYYAVVVDGTHIRLADSATDALAAAPVVFTSLGSGNTDTLNTTIVVNGIGNTASLAAVDLSGAQPVTGQALNGSQYLNAGTSSDAAIAAVLGGVTALGLLKAPASAGSSVVSGVIGSKFSIAGSVVINIDDHTVQALIGNLATAASPTVLSTPQSIVNSATITQAEQEVAVTAAAITGSSVAAGKRGVAVALGVAVGRYTNEAQSIIGSNTIADAGAGLTVASDVNYPILVDPTTLASGITSGFVNSGFSELHNLLDGTLGVGTAILNTWVVSQASPVALAAHTTSINGSIAIDTFNNTSHALIESGAQINQTPAQKTSGQSVTVAAGIEMTMIDLAGIGNLSLNPNGVANTVHSGSAAAALTGGALIDAFGRSTGSSIGGSVLLNELNNDTLAEVGYNPAVQAGRNVDPNFTDAATPVNAQTTAIGTGSAGAFTVAANEDLFRIDIAQAGGLTTGVGASLAFAGSGLYFRDRSSTIADVASGVHGVTVTGGGTVSVTATTGVPTAAAPNGGTQVAIVGDIVVGYGGADSIGISVLVNEVSRSTLALVGADSVTPGTLPIGIVTIAAGNLTVGATTAGALVAVGVAGVVGGGVVKPSAISTPLSLAAIPGLGALALLFSGGVGLAGSGLVNLVDTTTEATVLTGGTITANTAAINAQSNAQELVVSGSVAFQLSKKGPPSAALSGAFALNQITDVTTATVDGVSLILTNANAAPGVPVLSITATHNGSIQAFTAALAATAGQLSTAFAGSFSVNLVSDTTLATLSDTNVSAVGGAVVHAMDATTILSVGGGLGVSFGAKGIGGSIGYNQIALQTAALVTATRGRPQPTITAGSLDVSADNAALITAISVSAGAASSGTAAGLTLSINVLATSPSLFDASTADGITAAIQNVVVKSTGAVTVTASDNSIVQSLAGALALGGAASGYGVALSWNEVVLDVQATVDSATIQSATLAVAAQSTQNAGVLNNKISAIAVGGAISASGQAAAGVSVAVNSVLAHVAAAIDASSAITAQAGVTVTASDDAAIRAVEGGAAVAAGGSAVGVGAGAELISNSVSATIDASTVSVFSGDVTVSATETATIQGLVIGLAGSLDLSVAGSLGAGVILDSTLATIGDGSTVTASGTVAVLATDTASIGIIAGQLAVSGTGVAVGAAVTYGTVLETVKATVSGLAQVAGRSGVTIDAVSSGSVSILAVGGAVGSAGISGSATADIININTTASVGDAATPGGTPTVSTLGGTGDIQVLATSTVTLLGAAGAVAFGYGSGGIGVGADVGTVTLSTTADIGRNAVIRSSRDVIVAATQQEQVMSLSLTAGLGLFLGVAGSAGVSELSLTTHALIDEGASVIAADTVTVTAQDRTSVVQVGGAVSLSVAGGAISAGAEIGLINKDTQAWIGTGASVQGNGVGAGVSADTGAIGAGSTDQSAVAAVNVSFTTANVGPAGEITAANHGLNTGDEVIYSGDTAPLGGLRQDAIYYAIRDSAGTFRLAASAADAAAGRSVAIQTAGSGASTPNSVRTVTGPGIPSVSSSSYKGTGIAIDPYGAPTVAIQHGVVVAAVSTNTLATAAFAAAGGLVGGGVAAAVAVHTINTSAHVDAGAQIVSGAAVNVAAARSYREVAVSVGAAGSLFVSLAPAVAVPVLKGGTSATILGDATHHTTVTAAGDVSVTAAAGESVLVIAVGVAASGGVAIGGSASVISQNTLTQALISGADGNSAAATPVTVASHGNVVVTANDQSSGVAIAGAAGIGIGAVGGAGAFAITLTGNTTQALIQNGARVNADGTTPAISTLQGASTGGVVVQAQMIHSVTDVAGSGAGGIYAGIAGAVSLEIIADTTLAAIRNDAQVNQDDSGTAAKTQGVTVAATDNLTILGIAGALGVGIVGIGAGVDVDIVNNAVQAFIGAANVAAQGTVSVNAVSTRDITSTGFAAAAGLVGLGGGISVLSIGSGATGSYSTTNIDNGQTNSGNALAAGGGADDVLPALNAAIQGIIQSATAPDSNALPLPTTVAGNAIGFAGATKLSTGDVVTYAANGGPAINGLTDGGIYVVIVTDSTHIELAKSESDAQAGHVIAVSGPATGSFAHGQADTANAARKTAAASTPTKPASDSTIAGTAPPLSGSVPAGTTALIDSGTITANSVAVDAQQTIASSSLGGAAAIGLISIGVGVAVVNVSSNVTALVGPATVVNGLGGTGSLSVTANRIATEHVQGLAGALSGFVSLGAAVAVASDTSKTEALLGANDSTTGTAASHLTVGGAGFALVTDTATQRTVVDQSVGALGVSIIAGLGISLSEATLATTTTATVGEYAAIGTSAVPVGSVTIAATGFESLQPYDLGSDYAISIGGGLFVGLAAGIATATLAGVTTASIGNAADIEANGAVSVAANGSSAPRLDLSLNGYALGGIAVGVVVGNVTVAPVVTASTGTGAKVTGSSIAINSTGTGTGLIHGSPSGKGIISGDGGKIDSQRRKPVSRRISATVRCSSPRMRWRLAARGATRRKRQCSARPMA